MVAIKSVASWIEKKARRVAASDLAPSTQSYQNGGGNGGGASGGGSGNDGPDAPPGREKPKPPKEPDSGHYNSVRMAYDTVEHGSIWEERPEDSVNEWCIDTI
jgi:hypothetical protein